ncbi:uncharacterized protein CDAR_432791 [Caerostris darwini]|uniref:Uncharacterized protein n=1 Tax=Caerostris darwini TaxID=1538125 RepID=A0AAV4QKH5_9ARAC|nr:uncharacterized protein CDAR_432791 [Caerostris darwini]
MAFSPAKEQSFDVKATFDKFTEEAGNKGKLLLEDAKRWFEEANLGEKMKKSVSELFKKESKDESGMTFEQFKEFIEKAAKDLQIEAKEVVNKLMASQEKKGKS